MRGGRFFFDRREGFKPTPPSFYTHEVFFKRWGSLGGIVLFR
nr:MAG TPA: hypothetical protein [Caudoviricetes sp.]